MEGEEQKTIRLEQHSPAAFKIYLESLYANDADLATIATTYVDELVPVPERHEDEDSAAHNAGHSLCKLWVLGDYLADTKFKNDVLKSMHQGAAIEGNVEIPVAAWTFTNANAPANSSLSKLVRDLMLPDMTVKRLEKHAAVFSAECLMSWLKSCIREYGQGIGALGEDEIEDYLEE